MQTDCRIGLALLNVLGSRHCNISKERFSNACMQILACNSCENYQLIIDANAASLMT